MMDQWAESLSGFGGGGLTLGVKGHVQGPNSDIRLPITCVNRRPSEYRHPQSSTVPISECSTMTLDFKLSL